MGNILLASFWNSFKVRNTILSLMTWTVASIRQGGTLPLPKILVLPPDWFCPDHDRSLAETLPLKITIIPISLANHIMEIS